MSGWEVLAQGSAGIVISRCPGGRIHLNIGDVSMRFSEHDFRGLADVVGQAAAKLRGSQLPQRVAATSHDDVQLQQWLATISGREYKVTFSSN